MTADPTQATPTACSSGSPDAWRGSAPPLSHELRTPLSRISGEAELTCAARTDSTVSHYGIGGNAGR
jgi:hypothetical protein